MVKRHIDPQVKAVLVERLRRQRAEGQVSSADVRAVAVALVVSERTVWRWLTGPEVAPAGTERVRYELTEADRDEYADWRGNIKGLWRARQARGGQVPPLRTLQRAFARELTAAERAAVVEGVEGRRRHEVYLRWDRSRATCAGRPITRSCRCRSPRRAGPGENDNPIWPHCDDLIWPHPLLVRDVC